MWRQRTANFGLVARIVSVMGRARSSMTITRGTMARRRGEYAEALRCWQEVLKRSPWWPRPYVMVACLAREAGNLPLCEEVVEKGIQLFPDTDAMVVEAAMLAERKGLWDKAVALWGRIVNRPNAHAVWLHCYAHDLMVLGRFDLLEVLLPFYRARFPRYSGLLAVQGMVAAARENHEEALTIWSEYRKLYPDDPVGWEHYGRVYQARELAHLSNNEEQRSIEQVAPAYIHVVADENTRQLLVGFESIGRNCEFGLLQRRFGAEPLGLLRFNSVSYGALLSAIMRRFEGMGDPENAELVVLGNNEFFMQDRRWHLGMHTFLFRGQVDEAPLFEKMCRRVVFLRQKLLEDFADARKVFVYLDPNVNHDDIRTLHSALRTLGDVILLHVRSLKDEPNGFPMAEAGKVEEIASNLFVGFLSREGVLPNGSWDIQFDDWISICKEVRSVIGARAAASSQKMTMVGL